MNIEQHRKVAAWHLKQAEMHESGGHSCGCPVNEHYQKIIDEVDSGDIQEELVCDAKK